MTHPNDDHSELKHKIAVHVHVEFYASVKHNYHVLLYVQMQIRTYIFLFDSVETSFNPSNHLLGAGARAIIFQNF